MVRAIIFDFVGVIAVSEVLANTVLADFVTELFLASSRVRAWTSSKSRVLLMPGT
jgi:hypothetical protein